MNITGTKKNEAAEAIQFAISQSDDCNAMEFLRLWNEGGMDVIARDWPEWVEIVAGLEDEDPE